MQILGQTLGEPVRRRRSLAAKCLRLDLRTVIGSSKETDDRDSPDGRGDPYQINPEFNAFELIFKMHIRACRFVETGRLA